MSKKQLIIILLIYTPCMYVTGKYFVNPGKSVGYNILFALSCSVLYTVFMWAFYRFMKNRKPVAENKP